MASPGERGWGKPWGQRAGDANAATTKWMSTNAEADHHYKDLAKQGES